jgi:hypothetical protein
MTKDQINKTIATVCGWTLFCTKTVDGKVVHYGHPKHLNNGYEIPIPDYCNDLNAMHEAEKSLNFDEVYNYGEELRIVSENVGPKGGHFTPNGWGCFSLAHLTAEHRAKSFIKVISAAKREIA